MLRPFESHPADNTHSNPQVLRRLPTREGVRVLPNGLRNGASLVNGPDAILSTTSKVVRGGRKSNGPLRSGNILRHEGSTHNLLGNQNRFASLVTSPVDPPTMTTSCVGNDKRRWRQNGRRNKPTLPKQNHKGKVLRGRKKTSPKENPKVGGSRNPRHNRGVGVGGERPRMNPVSPKCPK
jgi:hypothetical protein